MTKQDIEKSMWALAAAVSEDDNKAAAAMLIALSTQVLVDLNRIANALDRMASTTPNVPPWPA